MTFGRRATCLVSSAPPGQSVNKRLTLTAHLGLGLAWPHLHLHSLVPQDLSDRLSALPHWRFWKTIMKTSNLFLSGTLHSPHTLGGCSARHSTTALIWLKDLRGAACHKVESDFYGPLCSDLRCLLSHWGSHKLWLENLNRSLSHLLHCSQVQEPAPQFSADSGLQDCPE